MLPRIEVSPPNNSPISPLQSPQRKLSHEKYHIEPSTNVFQKIAAMNELNRMHSPSPHQIVEKLEEPSINTNQIISNNCEEKNLYSPNHNIKNLNESSINSSPNITNKPTENKFSHQHKINKLSLSDSHIITLQEEEKRTSKSRPHSARSEPTHKGKDKIQAEKSEIGERPLLKRGKSLASMETRHITEIYEKKIREDNESPLSFRQATHMQRRDRSINIENNENDLTSFKELKMLSKSDSEHFDHKFELLLKKNYEKFTSIECTVDIISQIADHLIQKEIAEQTKEKRLLTIVQWATANPTRSKELVEIVHNTLLPSCPIYKRLRFLYRILVDFSSAIGMTPFTNLFHSALVELTSLKPVQESHKGLLSKGINLNQFLTCIDKINNYTYKPEGKYVDENSKLIELNKRIKPLIFMAFGDSKKTRIKVLQILRDWNDSIAMIEVLKQKLYQLTCDSIVRQTISCNENLWTESIDNSVNKQKPIDQTSYIDMVESYVRHGIITGKISINGEMLEIASPCDENEFFFILLSKLYLAFGFEIPEGESTNKDSLKGQIKILLSNSQADFDCFTPETLRCFRLLKMGGIISWGKADLCLRVGLGDLLTTGPLVLGPRDLKDERLYNFHIDKKDYQNSYAEQIKTYNICLAGDFTEIKAKFPVEWRVYYPEDQLWHCSLRILKVSIYDNAGQIVTERIVKHMMNFMQAPASLEYFEQRNIHIGRRSKKSLVAEAQGIEIIPAPPKAIIEVLKYSPKSDKEV